MDVSGSSSYYTQLAGMAGTVQSQNLMMELSTRVLKQVMDTQQQQSDTLLKMINATTTSLEGAGRLVNLQV